MAYRGGWGFKYPLPHRNSEGPPKSCQTQPDCEKLLKIAEFRSPTPQDVREKGSKILKLPPVRNCFTLAMASKLVVIINSRKVPKIKKILLYEMKFLVPNYSCLQNPWLGSYRPQIPVLSVLNWICWTPSRTKFLGTPLVSISLLSISVARYRTRTGKETQNDMKSNGTRPIRYTSMPT